MKRELAQLRNATPQELVEAHSRALIQIEFIWQIVGERLDNAAGDDRLCAQAVASAQAREMMHLAKAFHAKADALSAQLGELVPGGTNGPVARIGDR